LQASRNIDPIPEQVIVVHHDIALVYSDSKSNLMICWDIDLTLGNSPLHFYRAANGFNGAWKLDKDAVAGSFNYSALVLFDYWVDATASKLFETTQRPSFVLTDQSAVTDYVGCQNGRKAALHAFEHRSPPQGYLPRQISKTRSLKHLQSQSENHCAAARSSLRRT
jgi:hypothetical protein